MSLEATVLFKTRNHIQHKSPLPDHGSAAEAVGLFWAQREDVWTSQRSRGCLVKPLGRGSRDEKPKPCSKSAVIKTAIAQGTLVSSLPQTTTT